MSWITRSLGLDKWRDDTLALMQRMREQSIADVADLEQDAKIVLTKVSAEAVAEVRDAQEGAVQAMATEWLDRHIHELRPATMYVIQIAENSRKEDADAIRRVVESYGAFCIVIAAESMRVVTFSTRT